MSSELQLDACCRSCCGGDIWWTRTKERQAWGCLQVKLCDPCLSALCVPWCKKALYKYYSFPSFPFLSKSIPPLACYNFDTYEWILIFFVRNVTDKVSNQNMFYCVTSNNICFCTTWQNGETRKLHFSLKCCITALPEFNQLLDFFSLFDSYSRCCMTP